PDRADTPAVTPSAADFAPTLVGPLRPRFGCKRPEQGVAVEPTLTLHSERTGPEIRCLKPGKACRQLVRVEQCHLGTQLLLDRVRAPQPLQSARSSQIQIAPLLQSDVDAAAFYLPQLVRRPR